MAEVLLTMPLRNYESTITVTAQAQEDPVTAYGTKKRPARMQDA